MLLTGTDRSPTNDGDDDDVFRRLGEGEGSQVYVWQVDYVTNGARKRASGPVCWALPGESGGWVDGKWPIRLARYLVGCIFTLPCYTTSPQRERERALRKVRQLKRWHLRLAKDIFSALGGKSLKRRVPWANVFWDAVGLSVVFFYPMISELVLKHL